MEIVRPLVTPHVTVFAKAERYLPGAGSWFHDVRTRALTAFVKKGYPTARDPDWKGTDAAPLASVDFEPALRHRPGAATVANVAPFTLREHTTIEMVFVDGLHVPDLSTPGALPLGLRVRSLAQMLEGDADALRPHLGRLATLDRSALVALNTAFAADGAVVEVAPRVIIERPVHLLFLATGAAGATASNPRNLVIAGAGSQVTVIETYAAVTPGTRYFTNAVTEVVACEGAVVEHFKIQRESEAAVHVGVLYVDQERASNLSSLVVTLGGALARNEANVKLDGEGCEAGFDGLYVAHGAQRMDHRLRVDHAKPRCNSREVYKGILDGTSRAVFDGKIIVRKDAQKTDAKQTNKNLLLSDEALVDSNPQLEIFANDVKCTHGSTTGQLDDEAIFYLRSRGIGKAAARGILTYAFARQVTDRIRIPAVRARIDELVLARLPEGEVIRESLGTEAFT